MASTEDLATTSPATKNEKNLSNLRSTIELQKLLLEKMGEEKSTLEASIYQFKKDSERKGEELKKVVTVCWILATLVAVGFAVLVNMIPTHENQKTEIHRLEKEHMICMNDLGNRIDENQRIVNQNNQLKYDHRSCLTEISEWKEKNQNLKDEIQTNEVQKNNWMNKVAMEELRNDLLKAHLSQAEDEKKNCLEKNEFLQADFRTQFQRFEELGRQNRNDNHHNIDNCILACQTVKSIGSYVFGFFTGRLGIN